MSTQQVWYEVKEGSTCFIILNRIGVKNEGGSSSMPLVKEFMDVFKRITWITS